MVKITINLFHDSPSQTCMHTVLTAHNGYAFDFRFLVMEMKRHRVNPEIFSNMHFADTFSSLRQVCGGVASILNTRILTFIT